MLAKFSSPATIMAFITQYLKYILLCTAIFALLGLYVSLISSPSDYQQGDYARIMYVHVPAAWLSLSVYTMIAACSFVYLVWHNYIFDLIAKSAAPIGALFCFITLVTGSLWGKPIWGSWWVWDARLTSMLILFFFYMGFLALSHLTSNNFNNKAPAALAVLGVINIPIIKFSVNLWNSLHQPASVLRFGGPTIHTSMLIPLFLMFIFFCMYFIANLMITFKIKLVMQKYIRHQHLL